MLYLLTFIVLGALGGLWFLSLIFAVGLGYYARSKEVMEVTAKLHRAEVEVGKQIERSAGLETLALELRGVCQSLLRAAELRWYQEQSAADTSDNIAKKCPKCDATMEAPADLWPIECGNCMTRYGAPETTEELSLIG